MQQLKMAESPQQREVALAGTFVQRLLHWGTQIPSQTPSNADQFEDSNLDQRVRESGEW